MKEKDSRRSKGVAFILYLNPEDALKCVSETNEKEVSLFCIFAITIFLLPFRYLEEPLKLVLPKTMGEHENL